VTARREQAWRVLIETDAALSSVLPSTKYFEIDSERVGARFGIWITLPPRYDAEDIAYPVIYQPDGNKAAPTTINPLLRDDPINPIRPFIQVCVGYTGQDAGRLLAIRARDLLPPGEPLAEGTDETSMDRLVAAGFLSHADSRLYLDYLRNPQADRFLAFLVEELDPAVRAIFRVSDEDTGLHGFSYGGLFAAYAALSTDHFQLVGAGSPGILAGSSQVLSLYDQAVEDPARPTARHLHVTVCERELTYASSYQELVGAGAMELVGKAGRAAVKGLDVTSSLTPEESHATGSAASFWSFLRTCYGAASTTGFLNRPVETEPAS
jgi:predicted alpha/beta superfamily hydrolase